MWLRDLMTISGKRGPSLNMHVEEALLEEIRQATNGNYALGNKRFQVKVEAKLGQRAVRGAAGRPKAEKPDSIERQGRLL